MAVRLSALHASRPLPPRKISGSHFCQGLNRPQGHSASGRIRSIEKIQWPYQESNPRPSGLHHSASTNYATWYTIHSVKTVFSTGVQNNTCEILKVKGKVVLVVNSLKTTPWRRLSLPLWLYSPSDLGWFSFFLIHTAGGLLKRGSARRKAATYMQNNIDRE
jgi:hypothetical protein